MLSIYLRRGEHRLLMRGCLEEASFFFFLFCLESVSFRGEVVSGFGERWSGYRCKRFP